MVPGLLVVLDDTANPRVQAHAAAALVNFSDDCPKNILSQYLDNILVKLEGVLASKLREVKTSLAIFNNRESKLNFGIGLQAYIGIKRFVKCHCGICLDAGK